MPELPEVETVVRTLRPVLVGRSLVGVRRSPQSLRRQSTEERDRLLATPRRILDLRRRGKWIIADLEGDLALLLHLGMTGRLRVVPGNQQPEPHTHLWFGLQPGGEELRFQDVRRFGSAQLLATSELATRLAKTQLGPEPFELTASELWEKLHKTKRCLKAALLDQRLVAGVGNIYADEALFEAKLHPAKRGHQLKKDEAARLRQAIVKVLKRAIGQNGSTIRNFLYGENGRGSYQKEFRVYQQTGEPCRSCKTPIRCLRLAGRSTHFCPKCQPAPRTRARLTTDH